MKSAHWIAISAAACLSCGAVARDDVFASWSDPSEVLETMADEGPAWHPIDGLYFSGWDRINLLDRDGMVETFREPVRSNGMLFDRSGRLVVCLPYERKVIRLEHDGTVSVLADRFEGKRFNAPNDLAIDSKGRLYFSDPKYGDRERIEIRDADGRPIEGVYRIDPDGSVTRVVTHEVDRPNGLVVSADDTQLFVAGNNNHVGGPRRLWRFDLLEDGSIEPDTAVLLHDWGTERGPDGMALDRDGRLYVAAGRNAPKPPAETADQHRSGVYVFGSDGAFESFLPVPGGPATNCTFGGDDLRTLYITAGGALWSARTTTPGLPSGTRSLTALPRRPDEWRKASPPADAASAAGGTAR